jgi:hypothetical protein
MKVITTNQCDFCDKSSINKSTIRAHEKKCFFNPITKSCGACLWFSRVHGLYPVICFIGEFKPCELGEKANLKTKCNKWIDAGLVEEIDIFYNEEGILNLLTAGDIEVLKIISRIIANGKSYYGLTSVQPDSRI